MSSKFIQRLVNYLANEVLIKSLANSKTFQRFAVRTEAALRDAHKVGEETLNQTAENLAINQVREASSSTARPPMRPLTGIPGFVSAFFKEIRKDLAGSK